MAEIIEGVLDEDEAAAISEAARIKQELMDTLAGSITSKFHTRAAKRSSKEAQWLRSAKLYYGKLAIDNWYINSETPFAGVGYRDRPDVNIVRTKCSIAIAQTVSMQFGTGSKNWDLWPEVGNKDPDVAQACAAMSDVIEAQLEDTKYSYHCRKAMWDRVILGTGVLKGPLSTGELARSYEKLEGTETWVPAVTVDYKPKLYRVNPWFFYPDETTEDSEQLGDCIEVHPMSALDLKKLMKHEGFISEGIEKALEQKADEYNSNTFSDFTTLSENNPNVFKGKYLVLEYHGPVTKTQLDAMSIEPCYDSLNDEYYGEVWVCNGEIIRVQLEDIEASFRIPYYICSWEKDPGSVFGFGVPLMMEDAQRVVNEAWHMILDNSAMSSGPQVAMQKHLIEPANGKWELAPNQIWYLTDPQVTVDQAIQFFNVPNVTGNIVPILQMAQQFSEEESQIPLITAGLQSPEMGDTATGSLIAHQASTTLLDFMSEDWDDNITEHMIAAWYGWNMQHNKDPSIKGAYSVDVRTSTQYKNKQLHLRDLEKLSVEAAQNPEMAKWINMGELQRVRLEMMTIPTRTVMKTEEQMAADEEAAKNQPPPTEVMDLQLKARKLALEEAQLAFEAKQQQQREIMEHEEKMTANQARLVEAQARVAVSQNEKETEIIKLAARSEETAAKLVSNEKMNRENNQTTAFGIAIAETRKRQENELYAEELKLKAATGSGV
jgi:hypothetical protein